MYRIIERYCNGKKVFECQENYGNGIFKTINVYKNKTSWLDTWSGTHKSYAIFDTFDEAKSFINSEKEQEEIIHYV